MILLKKIILCILLEHTILLCLLLLSMSQHTQPGININISSDKPAVLELKSTTKGGVFPRVTEVERDTIVTPKEDLIVYCTDCMPKGIYTYRSASWELIVGGSKF